MYYNHLIGNIMGLGLPGSQKTHNCKEIDKFGSTDNTVKNMAEEAEQRGLYLRLKYDEPTSIDDDTIPCSSTIKAM